MALNSMISLGATIECIDYAISKGAHIINASWTFPFSQSLLDTIRSAGNRGMILVAAAGNANADNDNDTINSNKYPATYDLDNIVAVAATTKTDGRASGSSYGLVRVDLGAPGGDGTGSPNDIFSTGRPDPSDYFWNAGTSMAAPHVSGAFALMKAQFPNDSYLQLINRVLSTTDPLTALSGKCQTGGRLNLHRALTSVSARPRNDDFANSFQIVVPSSQTAITATGNNVGATYETGEPTGAGRSVWWHWTPSSSGTVEIRTRGSMFNTRLAVYTGSSVSSLTPVVSATASGGCSWSQVSYSATAGTTYRIVVDGQNSSALGSIKLTILTSGSTSQTTLNFDRTTVQRPSGQFRVTVVGPANQTVTLDRFPGLSTPGSNPWQVGYASFVLSAQGTYAYTDTQASGLYRLYRASIGSLKSCNSVGYVDLSMPAGQSMIANPLNSVDNRFSALFPNPPDSTTIYKFDDETDDYLISTYSSGQWFGGDLTLAPGEGAIIALPSSYTRSLVGEILQGYLVGSVPSGFSIRASRAPISGPVALGLGTPILEGDLVTRMVSGTYQTYAYRNGFWINDSGIQVAEPVIAIGESFWIGKPADWVQLFSVWP